MQDSADYDFFPKQGKLLVSRPVFATMMIKYFSQFSCQHSSMDTYAELICYRCISYGNNSTLKLKQQRDYHYSTLKRKCGLNEASDGHETSDSLRFLNLHRRELPDQMTVISFKYGIRCMLLFFVCIFKRVLVHLNLINCVFVS